MRAAALVDLCAELLQRVLKLDAPSDGVVSAFFRSHRNLGPRERTRQEVLWEIFASEER